MLNLRRRAGRDGGHRGGSEQVHGQAGGRHEGGADHDGPEVPAQGPRVRFEGEMRHHHGWGHEQDEDVTLKGCTVDNTGIMRRGGPAPPCWLPAQGRGTAMAACVVVLAQRGKELWEQRHRGSTIFYCWEEKMRNY